MKSLKKLSRENPRILRGGITEGCTRIQSSAADQEMFTCVDARNSGAIISQ